MFPRFRRHDIQRYEQTEDKDRARILANGDALDLIRYMVYCEILPPPKAYLQGADKEIAWKEMAIEYAFVDRMFSQLDMIASHNEE